MRWVRRAESGASILEYAAVVVLVGTIAAALIASGLPSAVTPAVTGAVCELYDAGHCDDRNGGDREGGDNGGNGGAAAKPGDGPTADPPPSGDPGADPGTDPAADKKLRDAQKKYNRLKKAQEKANSAAGGFDKELLKLLKDMIGAEDAKKCFTEGDLIACVKTAAGSLGPIKSARAALKLPKAISLFKKWRKASKALDKANDRLNKQKKKLDALKKKAKQDKKKRKPSCTLAGGRKNSFLPGTPVLMADGTRLPIEDIAIGDSVLAFDPRTGQEGPRPVTDTIRGTGPKTLTTLTVTGDDGTATRLTATAEHPFWNPDTARWTDAADLRPGDRLRTARGDWAQVRTTATRTAADQDVHNLTIGGLHTYYVGAGERALLVHNENECRIKKNINKDDVAELKKNGVKFSEKDLLATGRDANGKVVFVEKGTDKAGLAHIIGKHGDEFAERGISEEEIPSFVVKAATQGKVVGYQGKGKGRPIYEIEHGGKTHKVAITVGSNGFTVGANFKSAV